MSASILSILLVFLVLGALQNNVILIFTDILSYTVIYKQLCRSLPDTTLYLLRFFALCGTCLETRGSQLGAALGFSSHDNKPEVLKYIEHSAKNCNKYSAALDGEQCH